MYCAMDQIVSIIAKSTYLYGGQASLPLTIRASMFYGGSNAAQHSDRPLAPVHDHPGPEDHRAEQPRTTPRACCKAAIRDDDPVICFEDGTLWTTTGEVPDGDYVVPLGQADVKREGSDVTIVAISGTVRAALAAADQLAAEGVSAEVVDPRSLVPLDYPRSWPRSRRPVTWWSPTRRTAPAARPRRSRRPWPRTGSGRCRRRSSGSPCRTRTSRSARRWKRQLYPTADRIAEAVRQTLK